MKSVYVLCRGEGFDHPLRRKSRGQRELHEDAMDTGVLVENPDAPEERRFIRFGRQFDMLRIEPRFTARLHLVPNIDSRRRVVPDLQHRETGTHTHRRKGGDTSNQPYAQVARNGVAINYAGLHGRESARRTRKARILASAVSRPWVSQADSVSLIARGAFSYNAKYSFMILDKVQLIL